MVPGATNRSNLVRHNDGADSINPKWQRVGELTRNEEDTKKPYLPILE